MKTEIPIEQLLRWRLERAEAEAPPAPRAARLLELARPWWETWPEKFQSLVEQLGRIQIAYGHAMAEPSRGRSGHPVPTLIVRGEEQSDSSVRVLYLSVRDDKLRLRFQMEAAPTPLEPTFEATFISDTAARPLFSVAAMHSVDGEYRINAELSAELARDWGQLEVTDRMPFRLILRSGPNG
jgi:hypothetical protein